MIRFRKINITDVVAKVIFRSKDVLTAWKLTVIVWYISEKES